MWQKDSLKTDSACGRGTYLEVIVVYLTYWHYAVEILPWYRLRVMVDLEERQIGCHRMTNQNSLLVKEELSQQVPLQFRRAFHGYALELGSGEAILLEEVESILVSTRPSSLFRLHETVVDKSEFMVDEGHSDEFYTVRSVLLLEPGTSYSLYTPVRGRLCAFISNK